MGAQYVGYAMPNVQDLATARGSAGVLYDIIYRVSLAYSVCILHTVFSISIMIGTRDEK